MAKPTACSRFRAGFEGKSFVSEPYSAAAAPAMYQTAMSAASVTPYQAWMMYKNVSAFAKVVDLIADTVASLVPVVKENGKIIDGHPVAMFLDRPGFNRDRRRFIKETVVQYLVTGTAYHHIYGEISRPPIAIDVPKTHYVTHSRAPDNWPLQFIYSEANRSVRFVREDNPRDFRYIDDNSGMPLAELLSIYDMDGDNVVTGGFKFRGQPWTSGQAILWGDYRYNSSPGLYVCTNLGGTCSVQPTHTSGTVTGADGIAWTYVAASTQRFYLLDTLPSGTRFGTVLSIPNLSSPGTYVTISCGNGTPEGVVTANVGSIYFRANGGAGTSFYIKETGADATGWVGK